MMTKVKIGDTVNLRGVLGLTLPCYTKITGIQITDYPREAYGTEVDEVDSSLIDQNRVVFDLQNGHWAYSDQIELIEKENKDEAKELLRQSWVSLFNENKQLLNSNAVLREDNERLRKLLKKCGNISNLGWAEAFDIFATINEEVSDD